MSNLNKKDDKIKKDSKIPQSFIRPVLSKLLAIFNKYMNLTEEDSKMIWDIAIEGRGIMEIAKDHGTTHQAVRARVTRLGSEMWDYLRKIEEWLDIMDGKSKWRNRPDNELFLLAPVFILRPSTRLNSVLNRINVLLIGELLEKTPDDLKKNVQFGEGLLKEVREKLAKQNLCLKGDKKFLKEYKKDHAKNED